MFICEITKKLSKSGEKSLRLTVEIRKRDYLQMVLNEETRTKEKVLIGSGFEIVKELTVSQAGYDAWVQAHPEGPTCVGSVAKVG